MKYNFNPRSREGSDVSVQIVILQLKISIRAPARGATYSVKFRNDFRLFQSALPRGERRGTSCTSSILRNFNPRSREGSDEIYTGGLAKVTLFQSALPRGERQRSVTYMSKDENFNPRSREGSDLLGKECCVSIHRFQSALPRGERRLPSCFFSLF